ncbi:hypothetical protein CK203_056010 [Vitis vinifera]|uniref:Uncharacterized protein n=1 Tax=Vitis vinifera TaxID=29760 RepID=A0A438GS97_VITVI|nr:hypothetical protein CK203_056010 [Vitis vinifera]
MIHKAQDFLEKAHIPSHVKLYVQNDSVAALANGREARAAGAGPVLGDWGRTENNGDVMNGSCPIMKSTSLCDKGDEALKDLCYMMMTNKIPNGRSKKDAEASSVMMLNIFGPICIGIGIEFKQRRGHQQGCGNIMNK